MPTNCIIGMVSKESGKTYLSYVECYYDGYPQHVGKILLRNYKTTSKVEKLIAGGDIRSISSTLGGVEHVGKKPPRKVFYRSVSPRDVMYEHGASFFYVYEASKGWTFYDFDRGSVGEPLTREIVTAPMED